MPTFRPEVSSKNPYWIPKNRTYELKYYCLQYPSWLKSYNELKQASTSLISMEEDGQMCFKNPTMMDAIRLMVYSDKINMIKNAAIETDEELADYILESVTQNRSYPYMRTHYNIPCCEDVFYNLRRRFFWILDKYRD